MREIKPHKRVNNILLGPLERPALQYLSKHMPRWINPDILTGIGVAGALIILLCYWFSNRDPIFLWIANSGFIINWFGDSLDGTLARYRKIERPKYGYFLDHTVDSFCEMLIMIGLGLSPYVSFRVACLALIGYLMMSILVYIRTYVIGDFQISFGKVGPTEIRVIIMLLNIIMFFIGIPDIQLPMGLKTIYDIPFALSALVLIIIFMTGTIRDSLVLHKSGK